MADIFSSDGHVLGTVLEAIAQEMKKYGWKVPSEVRNAFPEAWEHIDHCMICADSLELKVQQIVRTNRLHFITQETFLAMARDTRETGGEITLGIRERYPDECSHLDGCSYCSDLLRLFREQLD